MTLKHHETEPRVLHSGVETVGMSVTMGRLISRSLRHLDEGMHLVEVEVQIDVEVLAVAGVQIETAAVMDVGNPKGLTQGRDLAVSSVTSTVAMEALESL